MPGGKSLVLPSYAIILLACLAGYGLISALPSRSFAQSAMATAIQKGDFYAPDILSAFYQQQGMAHIWVKGGASQAKVKEMVDLLSDSWTHGLNPDNYHVARIKELMADGPSVTRTELDMLLSDAVVRYARDMTSMRISGKGADDLRFWRKPLGPEEILQTIVLSSDPVQKLRELEPGGKLYAKLRQELASLAGKAPLSQDPLKIKGLLKPGMVHPEVIKIREQFNITSSDAKSEVYDEGLSARIVSFQRRHGLKADGIIGPATLELLNKTDRDRKIQIIANLERLRWMDQSMPDRYILVNIPSASLWAVEKGAVAVEMPVIVGKTARPTYSFKTDITGVRFNPNWTVPPTIKKADFLPMLRQDPYALSRKGIRLIRDGQDIDPASLDWSSMSSGQLSRLKMVQNPGDDNPLGKIRVIMENPYNIYLHDTNHRSLFEGSERALSSGCIRLSRPEEVANFILKNNTGWTEKKAQDLIGSGKMRDIRTEQSVPVYITYQTVWLDSQGQLVYGRDIYGEDKSLTNLIQKQSGIYFPQQVDNKQISL